MNWKSDFFWHAIHILVLWGLAVAQPLFDLLSRNPEFFVARHAEPVDVLLLVALLCLVLPAVIAAVEGVAGLVGRQIRQGVHLVIVTGLVALIALQALSSLSNFPGISLLSGALIFGGGVAIGYRYLPVVRTFLTALSPTLLLFPILFLFYSPVSKVVFVQRKSEVVKAPIATTTPVVFILFDELPVMSLMDEHRQIDPIRYPNFASLARDATWFRNATTVISTTTVAVPAILNGLYPNGRRIPTLAEYPDNLFTLLNGSYEMKIVEPITMLSPTTVDDEDGNVHKLAQRIRSMVADLSVVYLHIVLPQDLSKELPTVSQTWKNFRDEIPTTQLNTSDNSLQKIQKRVRFSFKDRVEPFENWVKSIYGTNRPTLYFIHSMLPHIPSEYLPTGKKYLRTDGAMAPGFNLKTEKWESDDWLVTQNYQRHLLQVGFVDLLLGKLLTRLREVDLYERALIIVTADHGVSFRTDDGRRVLSETNFFDLMSVPLFIKAPYQQDGVISDRNVEVIDILPTIADILEISLPWSIDGQSAVDSTVLAHKKQTIFSANTKQKYEYTFSALEAKYATLEKKLRIFGSGNKMKGLFNIGLHSELVGSRLSEVHLVGQAAVNLSLDEPLLFTQVDLQSDLVPAYLTGRVRSEDAGEKPLNLAVAINGTIQAVTRTFGGKEEQKKWSAMVDPASLRTGRNEVEVFVVVEQSDGRLALMRPKTAPGVVTYSLFFSEEQGREILRTMDGKSIPVIPKALRGVIARAEMTDAGSAVFSGWAIDVKNAQLPEVIVIFANGKLLYTGRTSSPRPGVVKHFENPAFQDSGFCYILPATLFENLSEIKEVRIFAVSQAGVASELRYRKGLTWRSSSR